MAYPIPAGSTLEIQIVGRLDGQTTRNVFHYWYPTGGPAIIDGANSATIMGTQFGLDLYSTWVSMVSNTWTLQYIQAQWILPIRYRAIQLTAAVMTVSPGGLIVGPALPVNSSVCVSEYGQQAGKQYQGRKFFPGTALSLVNSSKLTVTGKGDLDLVAAEMLNPLDDGIGAEVVPVILKKGTAPVTAKIVQETIARDTTRCARRRTVGRGE